MSTPNSGQQNDIAIYTRGVSKYFPGVQALKELDFEVRRGEVHALVGENGAGKSTLMKIIVREYLEDEGDVFIDNQNAKGMGIRDVQQLGLSLIHQELNLVPMLTVAHNICLGQEPLTRFRTIDWKRMRDKAKEFLDQISPEINLADRVQDLSIPHQQLVAIARSLTTKPRFLILDEPTARLDQKATENLFSFLANVKNKGLTVIYISHQLEEIYQICDRITVLRDGKKIITAPVNELPQGDLIRRMVGMEITQQVPKEHVPIGEVILSVRDLSPEKKGENINFELKSGEILGIVGSIGAGKSEVAHAIFGSDPKKSGTILISGRELNTRNPAEAVNAGLALIPEERKAQGLVGNESVRKNMTIASLEKRFCAARLWIKQTKEKEAVRESITTLKIATRGTEQEVQFLSGGTQQKVVLGKWLMSDSDIYLFDEPTKGIDVGGKHEIYRLIMELARQGAGIVFISNELPEVLSLCDRILVMYQGRIAKELSATTTNREEILFYVMGGKENEQDTKQSWPTDQ